MKRLLIAVLTALALVLGAATVANAAFTTIHNNYASTTIDVQGKNAAGATVVLSLAPGGTLGSASFSPRYFKVGYGWCAKWGRPGYSASGTVYGPPNPGTYSWYPVPYSIWVAAYRC